MIIDRVMSRQSGMLRRAGRMTFSALAVPNYRRYFIGQSVSLVGTWMQTTAQAWLVLTLTNSATDLGYVIALQTLPVLILGPYGGVIADRVDKRRLMVALQTLMGIQALALGVLTITHTVRLWHICVLAVLLGLNNTFENPARQAFVLEMVGSDDLRNAVTLNSVTVNAARAVGPAIAGVFIATIGYRNLLFGQRGQLRRSRVLPGVHGRVGPGSESADGARARTAPGRLGLCPPQSASAGSACDDGHGRHAHL